MKLTESDLKTVDMFRRCTRGEGCKGCPNEDDGEKCCELPQEASRLLDKLTEFATSICGR